MSSAVFLLHLLLLLVCLVPQSGTSVSVDEVQRMIRKRQQRPAFLFDAWGKRGLSSPPSWRVVGEFEDSYLVVIPKAIFKSTETVDLTDEVETPYGPQQMSLKRGAYHNLPWG